MAELYNTAIAQLDGGVGWTDDTRAFRILLLKNSPSPTFVATHGTVAAVLGHADNTECTDASYGRVVVAHANRTVVPGTRKYQFHMTAAADFGALTSETVGGAILFEFITDDSASVPIAFMTSTNFPLVTNGAGFTLTQGANGLFEIEGVAGV